MLLIRWWWLDWSLVMMMMMMNGCVKGGLSPGRPDGGKRLGTCWSMLSSSFQRIIIRSIGWIMSVSFHWSAIHVNLSSDIIASSQTLCLVQYVHCTVYSVHWTVYIGGWKLEVIQIMQHVVRISFSLSFIFFKELEREGRPAAGRTPLKTLVDSQSMERSI